MENSPSEFMNREIRRQIDDLRRRELKIRELDKSRREATMNQIRELRIKRLELTKRIQ